VLTVEDPVEYGIDGIMQVPVNVAAGLSFGSAMRAFLRQDPDVIMVGEIRDVETAETAIQASLTGHLVLSTLHTNDAPGAVARLLDMGIEPFLVAATVEGILAQRLLRRVCSSCREPCGPSAAVLRGLGVSGPFGANPIFFAGRGCAACANSGYRGRVGIYEWLPMTDGLRELVTEDGAGLGLRELAKNSGLRSLRDEGVRAALAGTTTVDEVLRHT
jgi:type IV pilus assembly protein PilB